MKKKFGGFVSLLLAIALTVVNGVFLYRGADWFLHGIDRPWGITAYSFIALPLLALMAGIAMFVGVLNRASSRFIVLAGASTVVMDIILFLVFN